MMLKIRDLRTEFRLPSGQTIGVRGVNLELKEGEFYTLLGPSGCGKTTTLRSVAGFETPDSGEIVIGDDVVYSSRLNRLVPSHKRKLGMVFQSYAIWPHMTVFENVAYPLRFGSSRRLGSAQIRARVEEVLDLVRLHQIGDKPAPKLSGGQQQRVALARALVQKPRLLLLDEPLSNLDAALREILRVEIKQLFRSMNITALYVTHDRLEALAMSDRVGVMHEGQIVQEGSPWDLYTAPHESFVAGFLGAINSLKGRITLAEARSDAATTVTTAIGTLKCRPIAGTAGREDVLVIVRPERVSIQKAGAGGEAGNRVQGEIENLVFLGESFDCRVSVQGTVLRAALPWGERFEVGEKVDVTIPPDACMVTAA